MWNAFVFPFVHHRQEHIWTGNAITRTFTASEIKVNGGECVSLAISVTQRREFTLIHLTPCVRTYWCIDEMIIQHPKSADKELLRWSIDSLYVCHIQLFRRFFSFGLLDRPLYHQPFLVVQLQWEPFYYSIITRGEHILWHEYYFCYFLLPPLSPGYGIL